MEEYFLIYRTPVVKHIMVLFVVSSVIMILLTAAFSPDVKNVDLIISSLIAIRNYLFFIYSGLTAVYLFQLTFSYQKLYFFNDVITLKSIYGKKVSRDIKDLEKVSQSRGAYNFHFEKPEKKIFALDSFYSPAQFRAVLKTISDQRIDKRKKLIFEYGKTSEEV